LVSERPSIFFAATAAEARSIKLETTLPNFVSKPCVYVILVNWNGLADTRECLTSLSQITYPNAHVLVVDNGSRGEDVKAIHSEFPQATVLEAGKNLGFAGGNNFGIKYALAHGADYLLCLNNDTVVAPDFLEPLVGSLEEDADAGIATAAIYYYDQPEKLSALGNWVDFSESAPAGHIDEEHLHVSPCVPYLTEDINRVPAVSGCVLMMRRPVAELIQGFDEELFAYMEDIDLCLRARQHGKHCLAVRSSHVWHKIGSTTGGEASPTAMHYYTRNSFLLVKRHGTRAEQDNFRQKMIALRRNALREYTHCTRQRNKDETLKRQRMLDFVVDISLGMLGCRKNRESYRGLEQTVRIMLQSWYFLVMPFATFFRRVYWKLYSMNHAAQR
jgi:GT2 family glycosyltransferase